MSCTRSRGALRRRGAPLPAVADGGDHRRRPDDQLAARTPGGRRARLLPEARVRPLVRSRPSGRAERQGDRHARGRRRRPRRKARRGDPRPGRRRREARAVRRDGTPQARKPLRRLSWAFVEQQPAAVAAPSFRARARQALRRRHNWEQLAKFCAVGATGYAVNLGVYALLLNWANLHYRLAATGSFLVAVTNNYLWNRIWTFRHQRGHVAYQGLRFLIVSVIVYGANLV